LAASKDPTKTQHPRIKEQMFLKICIFHQLARIKKMEEKGKKKKK
jgi:hypothetical protein